MKYYARSLSDIADHFDARVDDIQKRLAARGIGRHATRETHKLESEIETWRAAADIIRNTELAMAKATP